MVGYFDCYSIEIGSSYLRLQLIFLSRAYDIQVLLPLDDSLGSIYGVSNVIFYCNRIMAYE